MKATILAAAAVFTFAAAPAFADCAADMTKIDEAMKTATLDDTNKSKADELLQKAKTAMDAKDEAGCSASTKEILTMLGQ
jgi:hypothetical protein